MSETEIPEATSDQAALFARVRRMMLIASLTTAIAISAVLVAIGYRLFRAEGSRAPSDVTALEPVRKWKQVSRFTLGEFEEQVVDAWHRAREDEPRAIPGIQCEYCPSALVCTRGRD